MRGGGALVLWVFAVAAPALAHEKLPDGLAPKSKLEIPELESSRGDGDDLSVEEAVEAPVPIAAAAENTLIASVEVLPSGHAVTAELSPRPRKSLMRHEEAKDLALGHFTATGSRPEAASMWRGLPKLLAMQAVLILAVGLAFMQISQVAQGCTNRVAPEGSVQLQEACCGITPLEVASRSSKSVRSQVEGIAVESPKMIESKYLTQGSYDCALRRPLSSGGLVRLEARVECLPNKTSSLTTPLTQRHCVMHTTTVLRQDLDGWNALPVSRLDAEDEAFVIEVLGAVPAIRLQISSADVSLFGMCAGRVVAESQTLTGVPAHWQEFVKHHRLAAASEGSETSDMELSMLLAFEECALLVGAVVTVAGELHRDASGALSLQPLRGPQRRRLKSAQQTTHGGPPPGLVDYAHQHAADAAEPVVDAAFLENEAQDEEEDDDDCLTTYVAISDDPALLHSEG